MNMKVSDSEQMRRFRTTFRRFRAVFPLVPARACRYPRRRDTLPQRRAFSWKATMTDLTPPAKRPANPRFSS
ncbi:MAG: hypothetical protein O9292_03415, partial [Rhodobacteraceae bacterium]|nr:hypothetical protein [Paracoccaceae bacterium]